MAREARPRQVPVYLVDNLADNLVPEQPRFMADFGSYVVNFTLAERDGVLGLVQLEVATSGGAGTIGSATLRSIEVGKMTAAARTVLTRAIADSGLALPEDSPAPPGWYAVLGGRGASVRREDIERARRHARAAGRRPLKRGRAGYPDGHYRAVALGYLDLLGKGTNRGILAALAEQESKRLGRTVPRETVRTWVNVARDRGFLTRGENGRAGAMPGPRLYERTDG